MKAQHLITASSSRLAAQLFNIITVAVMMTSLSALLLGKLLASQKVGFLPFVLSLPPVMIWMAASIFVYASIAHHPNSRTAHYNMWAGYRFYGVMGSLVVIGPAIYGLLDGWPGLMLVLGLAVTIIVPWALFDIFRAAREPWQDMTVEVENNE
jgi:divalent metal cation (Fe/Co/Zn/Cd) transporter